VCLVVVTTAIIPLTLYWKRRARLRNLFTTGYLPSERARLSEWEYERTIPVGKETDILFGVMLNSGHKISRFNIQPCQTDIGGTTEGAMEVVRVYDMRLRREFTRFDKGNDSLYGTARNLQAEPDAEGGMYCEYLPPLERKKGEALELRVTIRAYKEWSCRLSFEGYSSNGNDVTHSRECVLHSKTQVPDTQDVQP